MKLHPLRFNQIARQDHYTKYAFHTATGIKVTVLWNVTLCISDIYIVLVDG